MCFPSPGSRVCSIVCSIVRKRKRNATKRAGGLLAALRRRWFWPVLAAVAEVGRSVLCWHMTFCGQHSEVRPTAPAHPAPPIIYLCSAQVGRKLSHEQNRLMRTKVRPAPVKTTLLEGPDGTFLEKNQWTQ